MEDINENNNIVLDGTCYRIGGLTAMDRAFYQVQGFKEWIDDGKLQFVIVYPDSYGKEYYKRPVQVSVESWIIHNHTLNEYYNTYSGFNIGIKLGADSEYIACIDIDGVGEGEIKIRSREYIFEVLMRRDCFKDCLVVRTANGGYHIYFKRGSELDLIKAHNVAKKYCFPYDCPIVELRGVHLGHAIEIFDGRKILPDGTERCSRFTIFAGSCVNGKYYEVISEQNDIRKIPVIEDVEKEVEVALVLAGFTSYTDYSSLDLNKCEVRTRDKVPIPDENIPLLARFLGDLYKEFHKKNCKFYATQALAGYLYNRTDYDSAVKLGMAIADYVGDLFDDREKFFTTLLNDFNDPPEEDDKVQGGNKFYQDYCYGLIDYYDFWETMVLLMGGNMKFCLGDRNAKKRDYIVLNRDKGNVILNSYSDTKDKDKEYSVLVSSKNILGFCPVSLYRVLNPLNPKETKLVLHCVSNFGIDVIEAKDSDSLLKEVKSMNGAVLNKNNFADVLNQIINKFFELNLVRESEKSSLSGVFIVKGELMRYDVNGDKMAIVEPDGKKIAEALTLIEDMIKIIPHQAGEIGLLLRKYFLYPFHYYFKTKGRQIKYILFSGAGGSLKSTLAMMCLSVYQDIIRSGYNSNVIGGGAFDSDYKMALAMGKGSMGFLVNEPDSAFTKPDLRKILKVLTTEVVVREKHGKKMYAYQTPIFATNIDLPSRTEFVRRQDEFCFTPAYVVNEEVIRDLGSLLNVDGVQNKKFSMLRVIGDYILYFISQNLDLLDLEYDELEISIVEALEEVSYKDLSWLKMSKYDLGYVDGEFESYDEYDNLMDLFVRELKMIYNYNQKSCIILGRTPEDNIDSTHFYDKDVFKTLIYRGHYNFLTLLNSNRDVVIIKDWELRIFFNSHGLSGITGKKFYQEYLTPFEGKYKDMKHGNHRPYDKDQQKGIKVPIKFILDLMNGGAYD